MIKPDYLKIIKFMYLQAWGLGGGRGGKFDLLPIDNYSEKKKQLKHINYFKFLESNW